MNPNVARARRIALVVGNSAYKQAPLANTLRDAESVADALGRIGFTSVKLHSDLSQSQFSGVLADFGEEAEGAELAVMFYAGHGIEAGGETFLLPVDAELHRSRPLGDRAGRQ